LNKTYSLKEILTKTLSLCLQEFEENLTLVEGKNHKNHLNASLLFSIIDFFIKTLLTNVKLYSVKEKNLNNSHNFSDYVYVKTNIIEEDFLKVINANELEKYKQFHNIEYYSIIKNFDTIKIEITNENKDDNIFADGLLDTIVTLHFKKRTKSLENDTSFLIKDNINYNNNNNNNNNDDNIRKRKRNVFSPFTSLLNFE
jgi:hypothetical protein